MTELNKKYEPNGTKEEVTLGILHNVNGYYVSNEGTKINRTITYGFQALRTLIVIVLMMI